MRLNLVVTLCLLPLAAAAQSWLDDGDRPIWQLSVAGGYEATVSRYYLAEDDTTETLGEWLAEATCEGRSPDRARHRWLLRGQASAGTELFRQRLEADYSWRDRDRHTRLRLEGRLWGRQYRDDTATATASDNWEGRLRTRVYPLVGDALALELRAYGSFIDYRTPSTLEQDYRELAGGAFLRSQGLDGPLWYGGVRVEGRDYPDTSRIDRDAISAEGEIDWQGLDGGELRVYHQTERRLIADETARPSAWTHWTDLKTAVGAGAGFVILDLQSEAWRYDEETSVYYDSWLGRGLLGYRWGDILTATWHAGLTAELFDAGDNPETYRQYGLQVGLESYAGAVSGSVTLEFGRRNYTDPVVTYEVDDTAAQTASETVVLYTDYNYWKIWVMGSWALGPHLSADVLANYVPESHTEQTDNAALGYVSLRLVWRR